MADVVLSPPTTDRVQIVLPTYNEAANIEGVLGRLRAVLPDARILVVDDNSPDGTADLAESVAGVEVHRRPTKSGLGTAYLHGFTAALESGVDCVVEMDADFSHDPDQLPSLLAAIRGGADLAIGSRYVPGGSIPNWSLHRRLLSQYGNRYSAAALRIPVRDATSGFRVYRAPLLRALDLESIRADGYAFQVELAYRAHRAGARIVERPITFVDRQAGTSKMSSRIVVEALGLVTLWAIRDRLTRLRNRKDPIPGWLVSDPARG
ncbi:MAG: polyprenol monophosphomannose synthase [Actinomycetia bacterium]|nr:polyprenol monophosphomannose synthase [Actinomycetes bacterium]